ncbi:hypothetical protein ACUXV3_07175 [Roseobacteraceae bacterium NS-SX3]
MLVLTGLFISAAAFSFWNWTEGAGRGPSRPVEWFTPDAYRYFWIPFFTGAGLVLTAWRS